MDHGIGDTDLYKVRFYASSNLINWNQTGEFGPLGDTRDLGVP